MMKAMKRLNRFALMIGSVLLLSSCYTADAACPRKHRHHRHHPKRGVVVRRLASPHQVQTDSCSTYKLSLALAERPYSNAHT